MRWLVYSFRQVCSTEGWSGERNGITDENAYDIFYNSHTFVEQCFIQCVCLITALSTTAVMADAGILHGTAIVLRLGPVTKCTTFESFPLDDCDIGHRSCLSRIVWLFELLPVVVHEIGCRLYTEFLRHKIPPLHSRQFSGKFLYTTCLTLCVIIFSRFSDDELERILIMYLSKYCKHSSPVHGTGAQHTHTVSVAGCSISLYSGMTVCDWLVRDQAEQV
jgi:hypothetical protein